MTVPSFIQKCIAPVFTAFDNAGNLDMGSQKNLLDFMLQRGGIETYFIRSGMGQMYSFGEDEVIQLTAEVCSYMQGKAPVLVGASGIWNRDYENRPNPEVFIAQSIQFGQHAQEHGAAGVVYTLPEAIAATEKYSAHDIVRDYFEKVCSALSVPVLIYQPPNTHAEYQLTPSLISELAQLPNLVGAKVSYSDGYYNYRLIRSVKDLPFMYVTGSEFVYLANYIAGSRAVIGQGCVINPSILNYLHDALKNSDFQEAMRAQDSIIHLCETCRFPQDFYKRYVTEQGYKVGRHHRHDTGNPYDIKAVPLTDKEYTAYKNILEKEVASFPA